MSLDTIQELYELVVETFLKRWSLHVRVSQLILTIATTRGKHELHHMQTSILDVLQHVYPRWQTHQPPLLQQDPESPVHPDVPHGHSDATAFVMNITCELTAPSANLEHFPDSTSH